MYRLLCCDNETVYCVNHYGEITSRPLNDFNALLDDDRYDFVYVFEAFIEGRKFDIFLNFRLTLFIFPKAKKL